MTSHVWLHEVRTTYRKRYCNFLQSKWTGTAMLLIKRTITLQGWLFLYTSNCLGPHSHYKTPKPIYSFTLLTLIPILVANVINSVCSSLSFRDDNYNVECCKIVSASSPTLLCLSTPGFCRTKTGSSSSFPWGLWSFILLVQSSFAS